MKNILFLGFQTHPQKFMRISNCSVLPSRCDSLPLVLVESLFEGVPIVATDYAGIPELVRGERGDAGLLVPFDGNGRADVDALARAMECMAKNQPEYASRTVSLARKFDMQKCAEEYLGIFTEVAALFRHDRTQSGSSPG